MLLESITRSLEAKRKSCHPKLPVAISGMTSRHCFGSLILCHGNSDGLSDSLDDRIPGPRIILRATRFSQQERRLFGQNLHRLGSSGNSQHAKEEPPSAQWSHHQHLLICQEFFPSIQVRKLLHDPVSERSTERGRGHGSSIASPPEYLQQTSA